MHFLLLRSYIKNRSSKKTDIYVLPVFVAYLVLLVNPLMQVFAVTSTWDFTQGADYTFDTNEIEFTGGFTQLKESGTPTWFDNEWKYRKKITIAADSVNEDLSNFPMLVRLNSTNFDFAKSQLNGYDIRFTSADGTTLLDYEREYHSCESETAEYWVNIPDISNSIDTDIYIYYTPSAVLCGSPSTLHAYSAGDQNEAFLDQAEIESSSGLTYNANAATKSGSNPLLETGINTATWDHDKNYNSVLKIDDTYKMWYSAVTNEGTPRLFQAYATSVDGITWSKPNLGLISYSGNTNNNLYLGAGSFNAGVVYDASAPSDRKYVAIHEHRVGDTSGGDLYIYKSSDGISWSLARTVVPPVAYVEAKEIVQRPDGRYIAYYTFGHDTDNRKLAASISDTTDPTGTWTNYGTVIETTVSTAQKYSIGVEIIGELYYGMVSDYNATTELIEMDLYVSRNGLTWTLVKDKWLPLGISGQWDDSMTMNGKSLIHEGNELRFYYSGFAENHAHAVPRDARIGLATVGYQRIGEVVGNGTLITNAFQPTDDLTLNGNFTDNFKVEVLDADDDSVITGFSQADFDPIIGDTYSTEATWEGVSIPTDQEVKLKFYIDVDPLSKADGADPIGTWNSNYKSVLHMSDDPNSTTITQDSTTNNNDGSKVSANNPPQSTSGKIYNAQSFDGTNDKITLADTASLQPSSEFTIEAWINPTSCTQLDRIISKWDGNTTGTDSGAILFDTYDGTTDGCGIRLALFNSSDAVVVTSASGNIYSAGVWTHVAARFSSGIMNTYVNGVQTSSGNLVQTSLVNSTFAWGIGEDGNGPGSDSEFFTGLMDEIRISTSARSVNWLLASYGNQNSPSTFFSLSTEQTLYSTNNPIVTPDASITFATLSGFSETANKNGGEIKYQISNDNGSTWYWYNAGWSTTATGYSEATTATIINSNIGTFPEGDGEFIFRAYLHSDGTQLVQLDEIQLTYANDIEAPSISLTPISPDPTSDNTPSIAGTATDAANTVANVQYQIDGTGGSWNSCSAGDGAFDELSETFTCSIASLSDGSHTVYVRATDAIANTTSNGETSTDTFIVDTTSPTGSVSINNGNASTSDIDVNLTISATDTHSTVTQMQISENSDFSGSSYEAYSTNKSIALSEGDGLKTVYIRFQDALGNESGSFNDTITLDTSIPDTNPPTGSLVINNGNTYTNTNLITLSISATDTESSVTEMQISENSDFSGSSYEPFDTTKSFNLTAGNGTKTVYIRFKDTADNESIAYSDTIIYDNALPTGTIFIQSGAIYTSTTSVNIELSAIDATTSVTHMILSLNSDFSGASYEAFATSKSFTLSTGDGVKTVYVKFRDSANNESVSYSDPITLDTTAPNGSISINGGAANTTVVGITLSINATDTSSSVEEMIVSESSSFSGATYESYDTSKSFTLSSDNGVKTVYIRFKDSLGNTSTTYSDTITLDNIGPTGGIIINDGNQFTNSTDVTLSIDAADSFNDTEEMIISLNSDFSGASYEGYATSKSLTISSMAGSQLVYIKFRDNLNNESAVYSDAITLDTDLPTGSITVDGGASSTTSSEVSLTINASDTTSSIDEMIISLNSEFSDASYEGYATSKTLNIGSSNGTKTIYIRFKDKAGNTSSAYFDEILKQSAPETVTPDPSPTLVVTLPVGEEDGESGINENVTLKLVDAEGDALINAKVTIPELNIQGITDENGEINLGNIEIKEYEMTIEYAGSFVNGILAVDIINGNVVFSLEIQGYNLEISFVDSSGNPLVGAKATLYSDPKETTTDEFGVARFNDVEPIKHEIIVEYNGQVYEDTIDLTKDYEKDIKLNIEVPFAQNSISTWLVVPAVILLLGSAYYLRKRKNPQS